MTKGEIIRFLILRTIGNFLLLFAIFGVFATFGPSIYYEIKFKIEQIRGVEYKVPEEEISGFGKLISQYQKKQQGNSLGFAEILSGPRKQILIPKDTEFSILIPKIGASAKISPNVDPTNEKEYIAALQKGVAHAKGTSFPGLNSNIYLFAHSTDNFWDVGRYNAVFYLLKDLVPGDEIVVFFQNQRYDYVVAQSKVVEAGEVSYLVNQKYGKEELILQTCWPPGTTWKRLLVVAIPK